MSGPSNSSDMNSSDVASTSVDAGSSQGTGLAEELNKKSNALQQTLQMLIDTPGEVEAMTEVLNELDCPVVIKDEHFVKKPIELTSDKTLKKSKDDVNIKTNLKSVSLLKTSVPVKESLNTMNVKTKIRNLKDDEILTLTQHDVPDYPYLKIKKNPKFDNMFILWNENADGDIANKVNFSSFKNTVYWAEKCDETFDD